MSFYTISLTAKHWRILHAIAEAPAGVIKQTDIQAFFGTDAMMEVLEQLWESGWIENTLAMVSATRPPQREPSKFRLSVEGEREYRNRLSSAPKASYTAFNSNELVPDSPGPGRPPGAKNHPKTQTPDSAPSGQPAAQGGRSSSGTPARQTA